MGINSKLDREIDRQKEEKKVFEEKIAKLETELIFLLIILSRR